MQSMLTRHLFMVLTGEYRYGGGCWNELVVISDSYNEYTHLMIEGMMLFFQGFCKIDFCSLMINLLSI